MLVQQFAREIYLTLLFYLRPPLGGAVNNNVSLYICVSYIFIIPIYHSNVCESINVRPRGADQYVNLLC